MYHETDDIELKRELTDVVKKEIVAFLNTKGGRIYVGVDDDVNIYEPEDRDDIDTKISNEYMRRHYY